MASEPIFEEAWDAFTRHLPHHHAAPQTPAPAPASTTTKENHMSLLTDAEGYYASAKTELGKFEQALPAALADAKKLEGNPLAQVAITAADHVAASILPPEVLTLIASNAGKLLDDLVTLYNPAPTAAAAPAAQTAQATQNVAPVTQ